MTLYIGVDLHPHQQTVAWCDTRTGEVETLDLGHDLEQVRKVLFFASRTGYGWYRGIGQSQFGSRTCSLKQVISYLSATPVLIRKRATSRHKNDRRDAELMLELLMRGEFPVIWRRPPESDQVIDILALRHKLVRQRTQIYNRLQALAHSVGLPKGRIRTKKFREMLESVEMNEAAHLARSEYLGLL